MVLCPRLALGQRLAAVGAEAVGLGKGFQLAHARPGASALAAAAALATAAEALAAMLAAILAVAAALLPCVCPDSLASSSWLGFRVLPKLPSMAIVPQAGAVIETS